MHITRREKKISGKSQHFIELLPALVKVSRKTEIELFPQCAIPHENQSLSEIFYEIVEVKKKNLRALLLSNTLSKLLSKSEVRVKFLRFPRSHSRIYDKIENSDISEIFAFSFKSYSNHIQIVRTVFHPVHIFAVFKS